MLRSVGSLRFVARATEKCERLKYANLAQCKSFGPQAKHLINELSDGLVEASDQIYILSTLNC